MSSRRSWVAIDFFLRVFADDVRISLPFFSGAYLSAEVTSHSRLQANCIQSTDQFNRRPRLRYVPPTRLEVVRLVGGT